MRFEACFLLFDFVVHLGIDHFPSALKLSLHRYSLLLQIIDFVLQLHYLSPKLVLNVTFALLVFLNQPFLARIPFRLSFFSRLFELFVALDLDEHFGGVIGLYLLERLSMFGDHSLHLLSTVSHQCVPLFFELEHSLSFAFQQTLRLVLGGFEFFIHFCRREAQLILCVQRDLLHLCSKVGDVLMEFIEIGLRDQDVGGRCIARGVGRARRRDGGFAALRTALIYVVHHQAPVIARSV